MIPSVHGDNDFHPTFIECETAMPVLRYWLRHGLPSETRPFLSRSIPAGWINVPFSSKFQPVPLNGYTQVNRSEIGRAHV